jgi:signal transduction histidine kinase
MFFGTNKLKGKTAAWRISLWSTLAFASGTMIVFVFLHNFVLHEIQRRSDSWLSGEVRVLADVAERTPKGRLYDRVVREVAELATKEVPNATEPNGDPNKSVFFIENGAVEGLKLWVGSGDSEPYLSAIRASSIKPDSPADIRIHGFRSPFRVVCVETQDHDFIYLGLSERYERLLLRKMRFYFFMLWLGIVLLGFLIVFSSTRRMLGRVRQITETASKIGQGDLRIRVPKVFGNDEIAQLSTTLNNMLDRIESSVHQLHTITDSLAHDLRSPMTAIRGKLELALLAGNESGWTDPIASAVDELDRLSDLLNKSLDVAEANADALRLNKTEIDLDVLLRRMVELYEPSMMNRGLRIQVRSSRSLMISADPALMHRTMANLFDNELKHLPPGATITVHLRLESKAARLIVEDDGPGFPPEIAKRIFERFTKGEQSDGRGLGLAFVEAVVRAHNGTITAGNSEQSGARIVIEMPLAGIADLEDHQKTSLLQA